MIKSGISKLIVDDSTLGWLMSLGYVVHMALTPPPRYALRHLRRLNSKPTRSARELGRRDSKAA